jgi:hypothetical protein
MRIRFLVLVGSVVAIAFAVSLSGQSKDVWVGTWKLNRDKSTYSPGPKPVSATVTITAWDGGIKQVTETVVGIATATRSEVSARFDGKDYPVRGNNANVDYVSLKTIDDRTYENVQKKGGKVTITSRITHSADGRMRIVTQTGVDARGQQVKNTIVYDRQQ